MSIIKPKHKPEKETIRISIENDLLGKIKKYCELVGVKKYDDFFEQAAEFVLSKDKTWQAHLKESTIVKAE